MLQRGGCGHAGVPAEGWVAAVGGDPDRDVEQRAEDVTHEGAHRGEGDDVSYSWWGGAPLARQSSDHADPAHTEDLIRHPWSDPASDDGRNEDRQRACE